MWKLLVLCMGRVFVYCYFYGPVLVLGSFIFIFIFIFIFLVMSYFFAFICFSCCIYRRLYTVGPSSLEGAQLNVRGGGFLL
jgi:hypothetical protein